MPTIIVPSHDLLAGICAYAGLIHADAGVRRPDAAPQDWRGRYDPRFQISIIDILPGLKAGES